MNKDYKYYLYARLAPTVITSVPLLILYNYTVGDKLGEILRNTQYLPSIVNTAFSIGIIFLLVQLYRLISKEIFQRVYFRDEIDMPTTRGLLYKDDFLAFEVKEKIREQIFIDFRLTLSTETEEIIDEMSARKRIIVAVSQIRKKLKGNAMLFRHNIEYGFVRNGLGGSFFAIIVCLVNILIFKFINFNEFALNLSIGLMIVYFVPIAISKLLINRFGHYYAKILFEQYIGG